MSILENILNRIEYYKNNPIEQEIKVQPEDMVKIHPSLTEDNPMSYAFFLSMRPDLTDEEKHSILELITILRERENIQYIRHYEQMYDPVFNEPLPYNQF